MKYLKVFGFKFDEWDAGKRICRNNRYYISIVWAAWAKKWVIIHGHTSGKTIPLVVLDQAEDLIQSFNANQIEMAKQLVDSYLLSVDKMSLFL